MVVKQLCSTKDTAENQSGVRQSIAILDLSNNQLRDFPDDRLRGDEKSTRQSYFIGLGFSTDGKHLYASMGSAAENGIAIYKFTDGEVAPEGFITIPAQQTARGKTVTLEVAPARSQNSKASGIGRRSSHRILDQRW
jgi:hypothetical protein